METNPTATTQTTLFTMGLSLYRRTLKRFRPAHALVHWLMKHTLIPILEARNGFKTMPDDPFWFRLELLTGRHESETVSQIKRLVKPNMTVLDIGGHVGYYTRLLTGLVGDGGRVVAFEPHPRNHAMLKQNVGNHPSVTLLQVALADKEGTAELHDYLMMSASGSLHYDESIRDVQLSTLSDQDIAPRMKGFKPQTFTVRTAPVDALLEELGIMSVDVVKMDIEGAEMGALRGMRRTIARSVRLSLVMEYNPLGLQAFEKDAVNALSEVLAMGFDRLYIIEADTSLTDITQNITAQQTLTAQLAQNMGVVNLLFQRG